MSELSQLSPQPLWDIFAKICSIPHPSYHEEQLAEHIMGWAKEKGLHAERDQVGNILIRIGATAGMENRKPVALQAHLDMVPQKNNDTVHDFVKDPIQPYIDGEWVKARGTTLGADNGIGMASALAVLADNLGNMGFFNRTHAVLGMLSDKDIENALLPLRDKIDVWHLASLPGPRGTPAATLAEILAGLGVVGEVFCHDSPQQAMQAAREAAAESDRILAFGSFYTVAGALQVLGRTA